MKKLLTLLIMLMLGCSKIANASFLSETMAGVASNYDILGDLANINVGLLSPTLRAYRDDIIPNFNLPERLIYKNKDGYIKRDKKKIYEYPLYNYSEKGVYYVAKQYAATFPYKPLDVKDLLNKEKFCISMEKHTPRKDSWNFSIYTVARDGETWFSELITWDYDWKYQSDSKIVKLKTVTKNGDTAYYLATATNPYTLKCREANIAQVKVELPKEKFDVENLSKYWLVQCKKAFVNIDNATVDGLYEDNVKISVYKNETDNLREVTRYYTRGDRLLLIHDIDEDEKQDVHDWYFIKGYTDNFEINNVIDSISKS